MTKLTRRQLLAGSVAALAGTAIALKPSDQGASYHNDYFSDLSQSLDQIKQPLPSMVVDKQKLNQNIATLLSHINGRFDYRIVAKSLPSIPMLKHVMAQAGTHKLMLFHQPFLTQVSEKIPEADVLMGKPMPVQAAERFYISRTDQQFNDESQLQWLLDSPKRLNQYQILAESLERRININIELDVGLHRGGIQNDQDFIDMLNIIESSEYLNFAGLMGYEPHIGKVPGEAIDHRDQAMSIYQHYVTLAELHLQRSISHLTLNGAGSTTYQLYENGSYPINELSTGSCLVKPCDFDTNTLKDHTPAAFIATPVLKVLEQTQIPGVAGLGSIMSMWNPNWQKTFFVYGGYWKAKPESPQGLTLNPVYGRSSNQEMLNASANMQLKQDDWIFWRPTQSESVFLQFGDILVYDKGVITERWPILAG